MQQLNNERKLWVLKSIEDKDRSNLAIDSYKDKIDESYNYDNYVPNHKQIKPNDFIVIIDKKKIIGFAKIRNINTTLDVKTMRSCPERACTKSTISSRKKLKPAYKCSNGHLFDIPKEIDKEITKYTAEYKDNYIPYNSVNKTPLDLIPYYDKLNRQLSMQSLSLAALDLFPEIAPVLFGRTDILPLSPEEANDENESPEDGEYNSNNEDERQSVSRQIKARRGQKNFRDSLIERYGKICMVTGCTILDILEAAHIKPYRGIKDNHAANGLLLRSDIHTLFDLNLLAVEPNTLIIHVHERALPEYEYLQGKKLIVKKDKSPSNKELEVRLNDFKRLDTRIV
ncbi:hypothetical protein HDE69_005196 [Pedobacter cryoconitis]|uniref:HNH nuclease domain-containing protein n=1 Tax=Pedobacter cryoconitis TaxID=188932 RepID=A0A7W9DMM4_9SPHI|nr:HNH endonuclease signature motif containing protein [Pedobacter cryoconitis]MBB5624099.1 hypothetical protein [Pedobacter cryoconitis]